MLNSIYNTPVMYIDSTGCFAISIFISSMVIGMVIGAAVGGYKAHQQGQAIWKGMLIGGLTGLITGAAFGLGAMLGAAVVAGASLSSTVVGGAILGVATASFGAGIGVYALESALYEKEFKVKEMWMSGLSLMTKSLINFGVGYAMGYVGFFDKLAKIDFKHGFKELLKTGVKWGGQKGNQLFVRHMLATPLGWAFGLVFEALGKS